MIRQPLQCSSIPYSVVSTRSGCEEVGVCTDKDSPSVNKKQMGESRSSRAQKLEWDLSVREWIELNGKSWS